MSDDKHERMTAAQLDELQRLHDAATPRPWARDCVQSQSAVIASACPGLIVPWGVSFDNASLVAAMRNATPELLAMAREVERLQAENDVLEADYASFMAHIKKLNAEVERLRAALEAVTKHRDTAMQVKNDLRTENDRLRAALLFYSNHGDTAYSSIARAALESK